MAMSGLMAVAWCSRRCWPSAQIQLRVHPGRPGRRPVLLAGVKHPVEAGIGGKQQPDALGQAPQQLVIVGAEQRHNGRPFRKCHHIAEGER
jgi:hypothetical protein